MYTNYSATIDIIKQSSLTTTFTLQFNLRLIRASQYLQRFELDVRYKLKKRNVVSDALSRLASTNTIYFASPNYAKLDALYAYDYTIILVEMSEKFKQRIVKEYYRDSI